MEKEIVEFIFLNFIVFDGGRIEFLGNEICIREDFRLIEELVVWKMMEVYVCLFSKYISDMFINFDIVNFDMYVMFKKWIIEIDIILIYIDEDWK